MLERIQLGVLPRGCGKQGTFPVLAAAGSVT